MKTGMARRKKNEFGPPGKKKHQITHNATKFGEDSQRDYRIYQASALILQVKIVLKTRN